MLCTLSSFILMTSCSSLARFGAQLSQILITSLSSVGMFSICSSIFLSLISIISVGQLQPELRSYKISSKQLLIPQSSLGILRSVQGVPIHSS